VLTPSVPTFASAITFLTPVIPTPAGPNVDAAVAGAAGPVRGRRTTSTSVFRATTFPSSSYPTPVFGSFR